MNSFKFCSRKYLPSTFRPARGRLQPSKVNDGYRGPDRDLEGVRSLGAALIAGNSVYRKRYGPNIGPLQVPGVASDAPPAHCRTATKPPPSDLVRHSRTGALQGLSGPQRYCLILRSTRFRPVISGGTGRLSNPRSVGATSANIPSFTSKSRALSAT